MTQYQDLLKDTSKPWPDDKNYFQVTITDLDPEVTYPIEFRWVYKNDKPEADREWSVVKLLQTPTETAPNAPRLQSGDVVAAPGLIKVNWDGKDYAGNNIVVFDRVEVYIQDSVVNPSTVFGDGTKPVTFFKSAGTLTIAAPAGTYTVFLKTVSLSGKKSSASSSFTITVESGVIIEDPTLPSGLSVATTAFGLTVTWAGTYTDNDTFTGFKSIDLYATTSNLGASTTTGLTSSNIVGNLTINDTVNKLNVGLEILKQVTGTTSTTVYTTGVYLYYIAKNANNVVYKVGGVPTYTRINSTTITPSKANKIDLENGTISIENLVAGNGQFTTWLRAGTGSGGARIELNGGTAFTDTGYSVLPGLSVYSSGGTPIFRASLDGVVTFGGYAPSDIANIETTANGKNKVFRQNTVPTALAANDIWINTYSGTLSSGGNSYKGDNTIFVSNASGTGGWVLSKDQDITNVVNKTVNFNSGGNIVGPIQIPVNTGSIYSSKSSYGDSTSGWFLGYNGTTPVIDIGNGTSYMRWNGSALSIKGDIDASTITGSSFKTSTSYPRVELKSTSQNDYIFFYDKDGNVGSVNTGGTSGGSSLYLTPPGGTVSQIALYSSTHSSYPGRVSILDGAGTTLLYMQSNYISFSYNSAPIFTASDQGLVISENNTIDNSENRAVRNIQSTTTTGYPTASGRIGDIIIVREA